MEPTDPIAAEARALRGALGRFQRSQRAGRPADAPSGEQLTLLATLHRHGPLSAGELAEHERLRPQSLTRMLARLVDRGLISRRTDPQDQRRTLVAITLLGQQSVAAEAVRRDARLAAALAHALSPSERDVLRIACDLFDRLARYEQETPARKPETAE